MLVLNGWWLGPMYTLIKGPIAEWVQHTQCRNLKNTNYLQEKNKLQHVVMVPLLKLGPLSKQ